MRASVASSACTLICGGSTRVLQPSCPAARACALAAASMACWLRTWRGSSSSSCSEKNPSRASCSERGRRRRALSSFAVALYHHASAAQAARPAPPGLRAARRPGACCRRHGVSSLGRQQAVDLVSCQGWPAARSRPPTSSSCSRPANLLATAISVASMRPLLTKQAGTPPRATAPTRTVPRRPARARGPGRKHFHLPVIFDSPTCSRMRPV